MLACHLGQATLVLKLNHPRFENSPPPRRDEPFESSSGRAMTKCLAVTESRDWMTLARANGAPGTSAPCERKGRSKALGVSARGDELSG
jgi:hypothetical protein